MKMKKITTKTYTNEAEVLSAYESHVKTLSLEDLLNSSLQDKVEAYSTVNIALQVSSKKLEALKESSGVNSLEALVSEMKLKLNETLSAIDANEELTESLVLPAQASIGAADVHEIKAKEKTWKEMRTMTVEEFLSMISMSPEFFMSLVSGAIPKVTNKTWLANATTINPLVEQGYLINKSEKSASQSRVTRQLSLEDLEDLFTSTGNTVDAE
jgi:hypothetical protein